MSTIQDSLSNIAPLDEHQSKVDALFEASARFWKEIYVRKDVSATIYQQRHLRVVSWCEQLRLPTSAQVLEVGCGAGLTAVSLAQQGYTLHAMDSLDNMLDYTRRRAALAGVADRVVTMKGDVNQLDFPSGQFDLVLAIGVMPWVKDVTHALREIARILKLGGHIIVTSDNRWRLSEMLDPRLHPLHAPIRALLAPRFSARPAMFRERRLSRRQFDRLLSRTGYAKGNACTVGFGPFSFLKKRLLRDSAGIRVHNWLQKLADGQLPVLRSTGAHYIVLAQKVR